MQLHRATVDKKKKRKAIAKERKRISSLFMSFIDIVSETKWSDMLAETNDNMDRWLYFYKERQLLLILNSTIYLAVSVNLGRIPDNRGG